MPSSSEIFALMTETCKGREGGRNGEKGGGGKGAGREERGGGEGEKWEGKEGGRGERRNTLI